MAGQNPLPLLVEYLSPPLPRDWVGRYLTWDYSRSGKCVFGYEYGKNGIFGILTSKSNIFDIITFSLKSVECPKMMIEKKIKKKPHNFSSYSIRSNRVGFVSSIPLPHFREENKKHTRHCTDMKTRWRVWLLHILSFLCINKVAKFIKDFGVSTRKV